MSRAAGEPVFALNHMVAPRAALGEFFGLAEALGIVGVEIRNDLAGQAIADGTAPATVASLASAAGVEIVSINALQKFNRWDKDRAREAEELAGFAGACGARALVLVPANDGTRLEPETRRIDLKTALAALRPILARAGIMGLVEPLGFATSSLRSKRDALAAIDAVGGADRFRLVHDTFHHALAGEPDTFAGMTGLVHISGVVADLPFDALTDDHRVLVDAADRIGNVGQIAALQAGGYTGPFSFEPFAPALHANAAPAAAIRASMSFIVAQLLERAA